MIEEPESDLPSHEGDATSLPGNKGVEDREAVLGGRIVNTLLLILLNCICILIILSFTNQARKDSSLGLAVVFGVIALVVSIFTLWKLPKRQVAFSKNLSPDAAFTLENEARKTLAQIIGGIFLLVGIYSTLKTIQISEVAQLAGRLDKAVEQLSSEKQHIRIVGLSTLIRLSKESNVYEQEARVIFTTHIREITVLGVLAQGSVPPEVGTPPVTAAAPPPVESNKDMEKYRQEIQLMINHLGDPAGSGGEINLSNTNLRGFRFSNRDCKDWKFPRAFLDGTYFDSSNLDSASFQSASLKGVTFERALLSNADFDDTDLSGVNFKKANIKGAKFLSARNLSAIQIEEAENFEYAQLPQAIRDELKSRHPKKLWLDQ
jgi:hypothetical protein